MAQQPLKIVIDNNFKIVKQYCPKDFVANCFARTKLNIEKNLSCSQKVIIKAGIKNTT